MNKVDIKTGDQILWGDGIYYTVVGFNAAGEIIWEWEESGVVQSIVAYNPYHVNVLINEGDVLHFSQNEMPLKIKKGIRRFNF